MITGEKTKKTFATLALFSAALIWGSTFVTMKDTLDSLRPGYLLAVRFTIAAAFLFLIFSWKLKKLSLQYIIPSMIVGAVTAGAYLLQTYGLDYITPGKNAFLTSVYCILVPFFCWIVRKKRPDVSSFIAAAICVVGVGLISMDASDHLSIGPGECLTLLCGIGYAAQIMLMERYSKKLDSGLVVTLHFAFAAIYCWIFTLCFEGTPTPIENGMIFDMLYLSIGASALALLFQNFGVKYMSSSRASIILSLESVFGVTFSVIFGREDGLDLRKGAGFLLVFVSVLLSQIEIKPKQEKAD